MDSLSIADIEAKVSALQAAYIRESSILLRQRNALAPISTLPPEVLCTIFVFVKSECRWEDIYDRSEHLDWVKVTYVCHRWREVGIQACYLWDEIPLDCVKWATEMLARSKGAPLTVTGRSTKYGEDHGPLRLEPPHFARIHELNIQCLDGAPLRSLWRASSVPEKPLPLHTVRLEQDLGTSKEYLIFPDSLGQLESHLPSLQRIMLCGCGINWNASFLCNVTHLRISLNGPDNMECYRIDLFLEALKTMPRLEMLYFVASWTPAHESELWAARKIPVFALSNLKFLAVYVDIDRLGVILPVVSLPSISAVCLSSDECPSFISALPPIFSSLLAPPQPQKRTLEIRHAKRNRECRIRFWPVALSQMDVSTLRVIPTIEIILDKDVTQEGPEIEDLSFIFSQSCLENLVSLSLPRTPPMDAPTWARILGTLSALEFININGQNAQSLFEALIYCHHELTIPTILFPSLLSISIEDMKPVCFQNQKVDRALQDSLIGALIERYELGSEIREIIFVDPHFHWTDLVCKIREVVVDVKVVEEEFWEERSHPESRMTSYNHHWISNMADWMGFWS